MEKQLRDILAERLNRLQSVPDELAKQMQSLEGDALKKVLELLDKLELIDGKINPRSLKNQRIIGEIGDALKKLFSGRTYLNATKAFAAEFPAQARITNQYFARAFGKLTDTELNKQALANAQYDALQSVSTGAIEREIILPLRKVLTADVSGGSTFSTVVTKVNNYLTTTSNNPGAVVGYTKRVVRDSFSTADRIYAEKVAESFNAQFYLYQGGEVSDSRDFCIERHGKYYHKKEVEAWAGLKWQGKAAGTNAQTIFFFCGGYNCMHALVAVSVAAVPKDVVMRNIAAGNYMPTDKEKKLLGIPL